MTYVYKYEDPKGCEKVTFTKQQHKQLFPTRKRTVLSRYEYYISDDRLVLQQLPTLLTKILAVLTFPITLIAHGVITFSEVVTDTKRLLLPKKYGSFVSDTIWANTSTHKQAMEFLNDQP